MKCLFLCWVFVGLASAAEPASTDLFNGRNLDGWREDTPGVWQVSDGMIIGRTSGLNHNDFLRLKKPYGNFVLKLSFRLLNGYGNSGIQFRSKEAAAPHEMYGYQADIGNIQQTSYWGCLYDESRRKRVIAQARDEALKALQRDGWNEYVITAQGNHITLDLNGIRSVDYYEQDPSVDNGPGIIALQIHGGFAMEAQFKNIRIQELPAGGNK